MLGKFDLDTNYTLSDFLSDTKGLFGADHAVTLYALDVVFGNLRSCCGKYEILACRRHLNDITKQLDPDYPYVFDTTRADRILRHFQNVTRTDVENEFIKLENWQVFDLGCTFGWVKKITGKRRFRRSYMRIARGHAKTTIAAGIGIYFMCGDAIYPPYEPEKAEYELQPTINIVAVDRAQGKIAREDMASMSLASPIFSKRLNIKSSYIKNKTRGGDVVVFSKDTRNKDGGRPSLVITEEWHAHETSKIHNVAVSSMGKKRQCLELIITTAGDDAENKPCYQDDIQYKHVLDGDYEQDDTFIIIREIDDDDNPHDKTCWQKANAFFRNGSEYGKALFEEVEGQYDDAYKENNRDKIREFLIKRMNRWQTDAQNKYFTGCMEKFRKCLIPHNDFIALTRGTSGHYGFDLGKTTDLSGVAYVTQLPDLKIAVSVHGFMPQNRAVEHEHSDRVPYMVWAEQGFVTLTPGDVTDNRYVESWIYDHEAQYEWKTIEVDYDGHNATDMAIRLSEHYNREDAVVEINQSCSGQNQAVKRFRELVLQGQVVADDSPLLLWCLDNAIEIKNNFGDSKLNKRHKDDTQRIDPVAAMMNALARIIVKIDNSIDINKKISERGYGVD